MRAFARCRRRSRRVRAGLCGDRTPPPAPVTMRIGIGVPPEGTPGTGLGIVVRLLTREPWLTSRPDGRQSRADRHDLDVGRRCDHASLKLRKDVYFHDGTRLTPEIAVAGTSNRACEAAGEPLEFRERPVRHRQRTTTDRHQAVGAEFLLPPRSRADVRPSRRQTSRRSATGPFQVSPDGRPAGRAAGFRPVLPRPARLSRRNRRHQLPDPAQRLGGADARRNRHAPRGRPRRRGVRARRRATVKTLLVPAALLQSLWSSTCAIRSSRTRGPPRAERGSRPDDA